MSQPAIFIDRDGTINVNVHHLRRSEDLQLIPGAGEAIARLKQAGYPVVIITNQSAIARGYITEPDLADIHRELDRHLAAFGAQVDGVHYCPHHPEYGDKTICDCRKPAPGLLLQAAAERGIAMEINANYMRLDLRDTHARAAIDAGVKVSINTDAHGPADLDQLIYGVLTARRAGATKDDVINCMTQSALAKWLRSTRP